MLDMKLALHFLCFCSVQVSNKVFDYFFGFNNFILIKTKKIEYCYNNWAIKNIISADKK